LRLTVAAAATALATCASASATTLSSTPAGDAAVAFRLPETSLSAPVFAALRPAGGVFGRAVRLTPRHVVGADVAAGPGGVALATWTEAGGAVRAAFREAGGRWGPAQTLAQHGRSARAALDARGAGLVVWTHPGGAMRSAARPPGGPFEPARDLPDPGEVQALKMDAEGDALVLSLLDGSSEALVQSSYRRAGGEFAAARPIAVVGSTYATPALAMNAAGDALAVYPATDGRLAASRRPAGGEFGPEETVLAAPKSSGALTSTRVADAALGGDGSAAVTWTTTFEDDDNNVYAVRTFVAVAPGGGSFGRPRRLTTPSRPGYDAQVAIDGGGDAVVAWGDPRFAVHAIYRRAGGSFAAPLRLAGPRLGGLPDVSIDDAGRATAAWEQNDGDRIKLATRSFGPDGAGAPAQVLRSAPAYKRLPHARSRCNPPRTRTVLETREARVYRDLRKSHHPEYACFLRRGKPIELEYGFDDFPVTASEPPAMALAGPLVAYVYEDEQCGTCAGIVALTVLDLRTDATANGFGPEGDPYPLGYGPVGRLVLRRDAALAYTALGDRFNRVLKMDSGAAGPVLLAKGKRIDGDFLRLRHGRVQWRDGGRLRSAPLR
jgi:hypothetical protein